ncbi:NAD(P)H-dependent oxidoreductase [Patescibacteria group bacterium]|jgi:NAD(P)H-dependent FMN reductase|nr:NAD(P)H-dependent oxidoreductase [Patescibacteria group bacterium]
MKLVVIVGTIRTNRQSLKEAKWVVKAASAMDDVDTKLIDLADYPLPFFSEPMSPRYNPERKIEPAVQKWLDAVKDQDAYVFVTPEYNHSIPGVLKNAIDYLTTELVHKPSTIVSHGTVGGARATMHLKEILSESRSVVIPYQVAFIGMSEGLDDEGNLKPELAANPYGPNAALKSALDELKWYSDALAAARNQQAD